FSPPQTFGTSAIQSLGMHLQFISSARCPVNNTHARVDATVLSPPPFGVDIPSLQGSILLVEDENFVREVTAEILIAAGYSVLKARSAVEGVREFRQHRGEVELLVVDVVLPGKSGRDMAMELMKENPC